jgi:hypothetical protein
MPQVQLLQDESPIPSGYGIKEENIHPGSGLRVQTVTATFARYAHGAFHGGTSLAPLAITPTPGQIATMTAGVWTSVLPALATAWNGRLPIPMTPTIVVYALKVAGTASFQLRVSGYDQFGNHIVETMPTHIVTGLNIGGTPSDYVLWLNMSKVFSYVDNVEMRGDLEFGTQLHCGWSCIPDVSGLELSVFDWGGGFTTSVNTLGTAANWGIGTPLRISPYGYDPSPAQFAFGTLTISVGAPSDGETVTIGGVVYTYKTTLTGVANQVLIGGSIAAAAQNLSNAINYVGLPGTEYTALTVRHPTVRSTFTATTVVAIARIGGVVGNLIATTRTGANLAWGSTTLASGIDSGISRYPEILGASGVLLRESSTPTIINTAGTFKVFGASGPVLTGVVLGRAAAAVSAATGISGVGWTADAWQGTPHKIGFQTQDAFATSPFELNGSSLRGANTPTILNTVGEDEMMFSFAIRSHVGTRRDSVVGGSYPR